MPRRSKPKSGQCHVCGCTEDRACDGGCEWANKDQTLCSLCAGFCHAVAKDYSLTIGGAPIFGLWVIDSGPEERGRWMVDLCHSDTENPTVFFDRESAVKAAALENDPAGGGLASMGCRVLVIELHAVKSIEPPAPPRKKRGKKP